MNVSVIIPALNESERICESVRLAWTAGADQVLVVDGGSTDQTAQRAAACDCEVLTTVPGRAIQLNAGAAAASGDVLLFLHADNWLPANAIGQIRTAFSEPDVIHGAFRQHIEAAGIAFRMLEWGNAQRVRRLALPYGDQGMFVRRTVFSQLGGFPSVKLLEDLLLSKRLSRLARPKLLPGPLHVDARRWKKHGIVRQTLRNWMLLTAYKSGISPDRLAQFYK